MSSLTPMSLTPMSPAGMIALLRDNGDPGRQVCQKPPQLRYKYFEEQNQCQIGMGCSETNVLPATKISWRATDSE